MQNIKKLVAIGRISAVIGIAALAGCSSTDPKDGRSAGRVKDDKSITETVEKKLKSDTMYKFDAVGVNTFGGVVQLNGFVDNQDQARHAEELARRVPGVTQVVNGMLIKPAPMPAPVGQTSGERLAPPAATSNPNSGTQNY